ncbi:MAG: TRAP transporter substrate-binding protein [bacterium]|jgi:C4-dicarboxylate-binding protein DctP
MKGSKVWARVLTMVVIGALLVTAAVGCSKPSEGGKPGGNNGDGNAPEYTIRYAGTLGPDNTATKAQYDFKEYVERESDGRIKVEVYHSGQLGGQSELNESVKSGSITMTMGSPSYMAANYEPMFDVLSLPFLVTPANLEKAYAAIDGEIGEKLNAALEEHGFVTLGYGQIGFRHLTNSKRPVRTPEDLAGIKVRLQPNEVHMATFEALGANPSTLDFAELYSALQQGVIDAQENSLDNIYSNKFYEAQEYLTMTGHFFDFQPVWINKAFFDNLPEDLQQILKDAGREASAKQREASNAADGKLKETLAQDLEIIDLTEEELALFQEKVVSIWDDYISKTKDKQIVYDMFEALGIEYDK